MAQYPGYQAPIYEAEGNVLTSSFPEDYMPPSYDEFEVSKIVYTYSETNGLLINQKVYFGNKLLLEVGVKQLGMTEILILLGIALVAVVGIGIWIYKKKISWKKYDDEEWNLDDI